MGGADGPGFDEAGEGVVVDGLCAHAVTCAFAK
jgi:hypothetical protein